MALTISALGTYGCNNSSSKKTPEPAAAVHGVERPRLVVAITIDQLPSWSFARDRALMRGGLHRLQSEGLLVERAELPYASTYTAPGHATVATGTTPNESGILANSWINRSTGDKVSAVADPDETLHGDSNAPGVSSRRLAVDGIADSFRGNGGGRSITISLKDRGAVLILGKQPDLAIWYEASLRGFTTSSFYAPSLPSWVRELNDEQPISRYAFEWNPEDTELLRRITGIEDDSPGEGSGFPFGRTFPHDLRRVNDPGRAIVLTPAGTDMIFDAAEAAIEAENLGRGDKIDLLGLSISSHDYAGHYWGQESWERLDLLIQLDRSLGKFFEYLDAAVGPERYAVVLTSDHGATPMVERQREQGRDVYRVSTLRITQIANTAASKVLGPGRWAIGCAASTIYLSDALNDLPPEKRQKAYSTIVAAVRAIPGIGLVKPVDELRGDCGRRSGIDALACRSIGKESGDIFVTASPGSTLSSGYSTGTSHGSPSDEDRFVPILIRAPGVEAKTIPSASALQVAPTITQLLGVPPPSAAKAPPLLPSDLYEARGEQSKPETAP